MSNIEKSTTPWNPELAKSNHDGRSFYTPITEYSLLFDNAIAYLENELRILNESKEKSRSMCENLSSTFCDKIYPYKAMLEILKLMKVDLENNDIKIYECYGYLHQLQNFIQASDSIRSLNSYLAKKYYNFLDRN